MTYFPRKYPRKYTKPKWFKRRNYNRKGLTSAVQRVLNKNADYKIIDNVANGATVTTTPWVSSILQIGQGTGDNSRVGNKIVVKSVYLNGFFRINTTPSSNQDNGHLYIIQDTQQVGDTSPTHSDIFATAAGASCLPYPVLNPASRGRYKILYHRRYSMVEGGNNSITPIKKYLKCNIPVRYNGSATTDIQKNGLYLLYWSSLYSPVEDPSTIFLNVRCRYVDDN